MRMDAVSKRQLAAAILFGIWAFKVHNVLAHINGSHPLSQVHLLIWCVLDTIYFLGLWVARIDWIDFRFFLCAIFTVSSWLIDMGLAGYFAGDDLVVVPHLSAGGEYSTGGQHHYIRPDIFNDSHIQGSHLVHVLPPTLAKFDVNTSLCLGWSESIADIPLKIKGTPPWKIAYEFYGYDGDYWVKKDVLVAGPASEENPMTRRKERIVDRFPIEAKKPGVYRLISIVGEDGVEGKLLQPNVVDIVTCPDAKILHAKSGGKATSTDRCIDESYHFDILMTGTPPLNVWYLRKLGQTPSLVTITGRADEVRYRDDRFMRKIGHTIPEDIKQRLLAGRQHDLTVPVDLQIDVATEYLEKILQISDGHNNTVIFNHGGDHEMPPITGQHVIRAGTNGDFALINGRSRPLAKFERCESIKIRTGLNGPDSAAHLPVVLTGTAPFTLKYARAATEEDAAAGKFESEYVVKDLKRNRQDIPISDPGVYVLTSVNDQYCAGSVALPTTCIVQATVPPRVEMYAAPVVKDCFGATGLEISFSMTGEPPFWVDYVQHNKITGKRLEARQTFSKPHSNFTLEPKEPGHYEYIFTKIGDAIYAEGVNVMSKSRQFTQVVHAPPEVTLKAASTTRCIGDTANVKVGITGVPPWNLAYDLIRGSEKEHFSTGNITNKDLTIETPKLSQSGTYFVDLTEITDGNGCKSAVLTKPIPVEILPQRPSVSFQCPKPIRMLQGSTASLAVSVAGRGDYSLHYRLLDEPTKVHHVRGRDDITSIEVSRAGTYELVDLSDAFCSGRVVMPSQCQVISIPQPTAEIPTAEYSEIMGGIPRRKSVCEATPDFLNIYLNGKAPFKINYKHELEDVKGRDSVKKERALGDFENRASQQFARITLVTDKPGLHTYTFNSLSDENYRKPVNIQHQGHPIKIQQLVHRRPKAVFLGERERIFQCISSPTDTELHMSLTGIPPFHVQIHRKHETQPREIVHLKINSNEFVYRPETPTTTGTYDYTIKSISDASGCETIIDSREDESHVSVFVADMAKITLDGGQRGVCVGDMISYSLEGTAPFSVRYDWNGVTKPDVKVTDPVLLLFALEAGIVNVTRVCNSMQCCTYPENGLVKEVKPLPKAFVDGGVDMIDDIREGDESMVGIEFQGTPPFSFRYTRTPLLEESGYGNAPEEVFNVENINTPKYSFLTDREGLFRVTWVRDNFCEYPPRKMADMKTANAVLQKKKHS
ncbi:hypothetical protein DFS34DRAFT_697416 [Phlyctochytrium arcticum]|nr:hypothetical protein DFS34DRAFT_697416 [Phlyctochytrium arcticum]